MFTVPPAGIRAAEFLLGDGKPSRGRIDGNRNRRGRPPGIHVPGRDQAAPAPALALALPEPRDRGPRADLQRVRRTRQDAVRLADRRVAARRRGARDRDRGPRGRPAARDPRHGCRDDPRRARGQPGHDRSQRLGRVPQGDDGRVDLEAGRLADRPVRRRVLLGVHDRRQGPGADPQLPRGIGLGVGIRRLGQLHRDGRRGPAAPRHRGHPAPQGRRQGLRRRLADPRDRPPVLQLRPLPDPAGRRRRGPQRPEADLGRAEEPGDRGAVQQLLPAPDPSPRREAALAPPPGGRLADPVPRDRLLPADEPRAARLRPARARPEPLRQARPGPVRMPRAGARVPPLPPRPGRLRGPAAQRLTRDAPGQQRDPADPDLDRQGSARPARHALAGGPRSLPHLLRASSAR